MAFHGCLRRAAGFGSAVRRANGAVGLGSALHAGALPPHCPFRLANSGINVEAAGLSTGIQTPAATEDGHPVIDLTPLEGAGDASSPVRTEVVAQLRHALQHRGYFYAKTAAFSPEYIESIYRFAGRAHGLSPEVKARFHPAYTGPDIAKPELAYGVGAVSTVRAWDYSRNRFTQSSSSPHGSNRFPPAEVLTPPYVEVLDELYGRQNALAETLLVGMAEMLGLPSATLRDMFVGEDGGGDFGTIRLLHYPGSPELSEQERAVANVGISAHTDFEVFTLMHQDAAGLQFIPSGEQGWVDAPVRPGEFVVIVGDVLERLTNGVLKATPHRVKLTEHTRNSIIRFNALHPDTLIAPLPAFCSSDRPPAYTPVTMRVHMETTIRNLEKGIPAWDTERNVSRTATYVY